MILVMVAGLLLALAVAACILEPVLRPPGGSIGAAGSRTAELRARRDRVFVELRDLEFDYRVGKLTEDDFTDARDRLELEAARILQALDVQVQALDVEIEREVREIREAGNVCPACGLEVAPAARFCASCGAALQAVAPR